jgi:hypothetical protein
MATTAQYASVPRTAIQVLGSANANRNGQGVCNIVFTANATTGSRIDDIFVNGTGSVSAGAIRLYLSDGTNINLWQEVLVTATTPSTTVTTWSYSWINQGLVLAPGWSLRASTNAAETFQIAVTRAGDF